MSSPKNACVGGYVSKKPIKKFEALLILFMHVKFGMSSLVLMIQTRQKLFC